MGLTALAPSPCRGQRSACQLRWLVGSGRSTNCKRSGHCLLRAQVSRQQELHSELLEEHDRLRRQGTAMRSQLDEAAAQLLHLKAQFEKGKRA